MKKKRIFKTDMLKLQMNSYLMKRTRRKYKTRSRDQSKQVKNTLHLKKSNGGNGNIQKEKKTIKTTNIKKDDWINR